MVRITRFIYCGRRVSFIACCFCCRLLFYKFIFQPLKFYRIHIIVVVVDDDGDDDYDGVMRTRFTMMMMIISIESAF